MSSSLVCWHRAPWQFFKPASSRTSWKLRQRCRCPARRFGQLFMCFFQLASASDAKIISGPMWTVFSLTPVIFQCSGHYHRHRLLWLRPLCCLRHSPFRFLSGGHRAATGVHRALEITACCLWAPGCLCQGPGIRLFANTAGRNEGQPCMFENLIERLGREHDNSSRTSQRSSTTIAT